MSRVSSVVSVCPGPKLLDSGIFSNLGLSISHTGLIRVQLPISALARQG